MKQLVIFDVPMCMAHRGLHAILQEVMPNTRAALFVNVRWTGAKLVLNDEVLLHVRTQAPMTADRLIALAELGGKLEEAVKRKIRLKAAERASKKKKLAA